jgi:hypothetical protein
MRRACLTALAAGGALLLVASPAGAKISSTVTVQPSGAGVRIVIGLSSAKAVAKKKRPTKVSVKAAGKTVKLSKAKAAAASKGYTSSWQSKVFTGGYATKLNALAGKKISVTLATKKSSSTSKRTVIVVPPTGGGTTTPKVLFPPPPSPLVGNAAFDYLKGYFLNSAFSDCTGVWPTCAVEERYVHCPSGAWEYHRNTPSSGSDIHSYNTFQVTGANVNADGSWIVSYTIPSSGAAYYWSVSTSGIATGTYTFGGSQSALGPMYWSQPAITWQKPGGAC